MVTRGRWVLTLAMGGAMLFHVPTATAQEEVEPAGPNTGALSISGSVDWTNAYFFRGILQEDQGIIVQPSVTLAANFYEGDGAINSVDGYVGIWNSFHDEHTGAGPSANIDSWYEADFYFGLSATIHENWNLGATFTFYTSPNDAFDTVNELALSLAYDDSAMWEECPWFEGFAPSVMIAFETHGQADQNADPTGTSEGIYLELGIEPTFSPFQGGALGDLSVSVPVVVGLSLEDYYESATGSDDTFGYASVGLLGSIPLPIGGEYGEWSLTGGVTFLFLGDNLETANIGDDFDVVGSLSIGFTY